MRSGVLVSVHAFASDPTRGLFILGFLLAVIGSSLLLFAFKGSQVKSHGKHELWSRETLLLCNNIMLVAGLLTVLLGTLLPLVHKELGLGSISIGTPFFNHIYSWLIIPFALLLGVGPLFRWRRQELGELKSKVVVALVLSLAAALLLPQLFAETFKPWAAVGIGLGAGSSSPACRRLGASDPQAQLCSRCAQAWQQPLGHDPRPCGAGSQHHRYRLHPELQHREGSADAGG